MECELPNLTEDQNTRIHEIIKETKLIGSETLSPDICTIETSKKNIVLSIHPKERDALVLKLVSSPIPLKNEIQIYTQLKSSHFYISEFPRPVIYGIPDLLHHGKDYIITRYIEGINGMDIITQQIQSNWNPAFWEQFFTDLIQWIKEFSEITNQIPLDCHIRNFLFIETSVYGVDFEELGDLNEENLLRVFTTLYFSILGAYPGVIEGLELMKKAKMGIVFLRRLLLSPLFKHKSLQEIVDTFLSYLQKEAAKVVQRRINLERGNGYDTKKIKNNLDFVISHIQSDFD